YSLEANLGSGKTIFCKGFAKGLGIKRNITSPTFVIFNIYKIRGREAKNLIHVDAYRIESKKDLEAIGLIDLMLDEKNITLIEWGDKIKKHLPKKTKTIKINSKEEDEREFTFL
ncbi:MAG: tRNA (adenosine(37)-N6)-threonylcarbamoyltransferase complex ATPase subunit type 1 TsaE, partial [Patescibacteria group bacterium]